MSESPKTRILLADDHALVRRGVRLILDSEPDLTVVGEAGDG
ncbi:DNA-binding response regulator, partial [Streptomyces sp. PGLac3x]